MRQRIDRKRIVFILLPFVIAIWPLWLAFAALPSAQQGWQDDVRKCDISREIIRNIITIDPDRLQNVDVTGKLVKFEYPVAVNKLATICGISPADYKINVLTDVKPSSGQASQNAIVSVNKVSIRTAAEFISVGEQTYYPNLKCVQLSLKKIRDQKDIWEMDMTFTHFE
jgi:hypothetical protein